MAENISSGDNIPALPTPHHIHISSVDQTVADMCGPNQAIMSAEGFGCDGISRLILSIKGHVKRLY